MFVFAAALLLQVPGFFDPKSCPQPYYWRVAYVGPCKSRKDLDEILKSHKQWLATNGTRGKQANLSGAILSDDDLRKANLWRANLQGAVLSGANLSDAILGATRQEGEPSKASPGSWSLGAPRLLGAVANNGESVPIYSFGTDLRHVLAWNTDLHGADLSYSMLDAISLNGADLSDSNLMESGLSHAQFVGTKLDRANFRNADLFEAVFEPSSIDGITGIESASHLESLTFQTNASGLIQLRKLFRDQGFQQQERELTYAINRQQARLDMPSERWFKRIAFDMTCQYGMSPGRCLRLISYSWGIFAVFFYFAIHKRGWMYLRVTRRLGDSEKVRETCLWSRSLTTSPGLLRKLIAFFKFEWRVFRASLFFSLVNAFSIGYKEFSIGQWLTLLSKREYEIKPSKWARSVAGVQSLLTVYLFALWLLTYFGQPFE